MFGLISRKKLQEVLEELEKTNRHEAGTGMNDFYYSWGVSNAVAFICYKFGIRYEDIAPAGSEGDGK